MAINRVDYNGGTLIDITDTTAQAQNVQSGSYFYGRDGVKTQGSLVINKYYTGSSSPSSSLGNNGDLYLKV